MASGTTSETDLFANADDGAGEDDVERLRKRKHALERQMTAVERSRQSHRQYSFDREALRKSLDEGMEQMLTRQAAAQKEVSRWAALEQCFRDLYGRLDDADESTWSEDEFSDRLADAQEELGSVRRDFTHLIADVRAAAAETPRPSAAPAETDPPLAEDDEDVGENGLWSWFLRGFAFNFPMMTLVATLFIVYIAMKRMLIW